MPHVQGPTRTNVHGAARLLARPRFIGYRGPRRRDFTLSRWKTRWSCGAGWVKGCHGRSRGPSPWAGTARGGPSPRLLGWRAHVAHAPSIIGRWRAQVFGGSLPQLPSAARSCSRGTRRTDPPRRGDFAASAAAYTRDSAHCTGRSSARYCSASATCGAAIRSLAARSAIVRATRRTRVMARAERPKRSTARSRRE